MAHFSKQEIAEIYSRLELYGVKDSQFPDTKVINIEDFVAIVQDGINKKISIDDLFSGIGADIFDRYVLQITPFVKNGSNILRDGFESDIEAAVVIGTTDVTDQIAPQYFSWERSSGDEALDGLWNKRHVGVGHSIHVTREDVNGACTFYCLVPVEVIRNINL